MLYDSIINCLTLLFLSFCICDEIPPPARLDVSKFGGFNVSIPDLPGMTLFAFHGNLNRKLKHLEAGEFSKDIVEKDPQTNRWIYENSQVKLNKGDYIEYWTYIIKNGLGFRRTTDRFIVYEYIEDIKPSDLKQPPLSNQGTYVSSCRKTTDQKFVVTSNCTPAKKDAALETCINVVSNTMNCLTSVQEQLARLQAEYNLLKELQIISKNISSTDSSISTTASTLLVTGPKEFNADNTYPHGLILGGNLPRVTSTDRDILHLVNFVIWEKLEMIDLEARAAKRRPDGTIIFDMYNANEKQLILDNIKKKFINSTIFIRDANTT